MPFFNSIPLALVIVQLVQLGWQRERPRPRPNRYEREKREREAKKNEKEENSRTLYPPTYLQRLPMSALKSGHQMKLVAGRARRSRPVGRNVPREDAIKTRLAVGGTEKVACPPALHVPD